MVEHLIYAGERVIGVVKGNVFIKNVFGSKHFLRQPPAICTDCEALRHARQYGATMMQVTDKETNIVYTVPIDVLLKHGTPLNRKAGNQIKLIMEYWTARQK
jgi:hypothetical protein